MSKKSFRFADYIKKHQEIMRQILELSIIKKSHGVRGIKKSSAYSLIVKSLSNFMRQKYNKLLK